MNKKLTSIIDCKLWQYSRSNDKDIFESYRSPSVAKTRSFYWIKNDCNDKNGKGLKVVAHNCSFYSTVFFYIFLNEETGELEPHIVIDAAFARYDENLNDYIESATKYGFNTTTAERIIRWLFDIEEKAVA